MITTNYSRRNGASRLEPIRTAVRIEKVAALWREGKDQGSAPSLT